MHASCTATLHHSDTTARTPGLPALSSCQFQRLPAINGSNADGWKALMNVPLPVDALLSGGVQKSTTSSPG